MIRKSRTCVLNMPMNEGQGDPHDSSGYGNNGTNNGADWVSGDYGWAMEFNGSSDYVVCADDASLRFDHTQSFTTDWWSKRNTNTLAERILRQGHNYYGWTTATTFKFGTYDGSNSAFVEVPMAVNNWERFVFAFDRDSGIISGFVNGVLESSNPNLNVIGDPNSYSDLHIGNRLGADYFNGSINDVRIYSRSLSATEILSDFNATKARYGL